MTRYSRRTGFRHWFNQQPTMKHESNPTCLPGRDEGQRPVLEVVPGPATPLAGEAAPDSGSALQAARGLGAEVASDVCGCVAVAVMFVVLYLIIP